MQVFYKCTLTQDLSSEDETMFHAVKILSNTTMLTIIIWFTGAGLVGEKYCSIRAWKSRHSNSL